MLEKTSALFKIQRTDVHVSDCACDAGVASSRRSRQRGEKSHADHSCMKRRNPRDPHVSACPPAPGRRGYISPDSFERFTIAIHDIVPLPSRLRHRKSLSIASNQEPSNNFLVLSVLSFCKR